MTNLADYIRTHRPIERATLRVHRNESNPDWVDMSIGDECGSYDHIATLTQGQLNKLIKSLQRHQLDKATES